MPIRYKTRQYFRTSEICKITGISRTTLWRWFKAGILLDSAKKDRRGWRLFSAEDIKTIENEMYKIK